MPDPLSGQLIADRYRLGASLGRGGMAEVRQAQDLRLGRAVAVKFLDAHLASQPELRRRFEDEARAAARLNHPSVVQVFDSGEWEGRPFLVMELLSGRTLAAELAAGPLPLARVRTVASDVLGALAAAHEAGIIHRDVKPANLLIAADGSVKVSDFGIAKADPTKADPAAGLPQTPEPTMTGQVLGTPAYLSPERLAGRPATPASDVWSVGVVCWEALAGRRAYPDGTPIAVAMAVMNNDLPSIETIRVDVDRSLALAVNGALRRDPTQRWPTAAAMREVLLTGDTSWRPAPPGSPGPAVAAAPPSPTRRARTATGRQPNPVTSAGTIAVPVQAGPATTVLQTGPPPTRGGRGWTFALAAIAVLLVIAIGVVAAKLLIGNSNNPSSPPVTTQAPATTVAPTSSTHPAATTSTAPPTTSTTSTTEPPTTEPTTTQPPTTEPPITTPSTTPDTLFPSVT